MNTRLQELAQQAGPVGEHEAVLTEADMPESEKTALLRRAAAKDNHVTKQLRAEATKARSTARGADHRVFGLQREVTLRAQRGRQHTGTEEAAAAPSPKPETLYADRTAMDYTQLSTPPDPTQDAPPV